MKRYGNLYSKIMDMDNLRLADDKARLGKRHNKGVVWHDKHKEEHLQALHDALANHTFKTSKYRVFTVKEPKEREIYSLPYYPDRILHHAIMNVVGPIWKRSFTFNSFACIKGRGIHACLRHVRRVVDGYGDKTCYCLKIDIKKFYPSVKADVMKAVIRRKIKCAETLALLDGIIDSAEGLPIGNYLSQYMANLILSPLMHRLNAINGIQCAEYSDDIVVFGDDKDLLWSIFKTVIRPYVEDELRMEIKGNWQVFPIAKDRFSRDGRGLDFVGYVVYRDCTLLRKRVKKSFARKVSRLRKRGIKNAKTLTSMLSSHLGWAQHANAHRLTRKLFNSLS